jgi:hypothetical protein
LFLGDLRRVPMRLHTFTELAKHKGSGIFLMYCEPSSWDPLIHIKSYSETLSCHYHPFLARVRANFRKFYS